MEKKKIVIAGAGYAGLLTAKKLARRIKKRKISEQVEVTIIDKNPFHTMLSELHEVAAWRVEEDSIRISLDKVFVGREVNVVMDTIESVDYDARQVVCANAAYHYDYLVLASGSQPIFFGVEGAKENAFTLWSYDAAVTLREHIVSMFRMASRETDPEKRRALLTFVVVGCGFTGVELAGELAELMPSLCERFELAPALVTMMNMDTLERVCGVLPEKLSAKVQGRLEKMRVKVMLGTSITQLGKDFVQYKARSGKTVCTATHTVVWTAGVEGSQLAKQASAALGEAPRGRVQTDEYLRALHDRHVYVGGDNIFFTPDGEKAAVPQMVENAEASASIIADNLISDLTGSGAAKKYAPKFHGTMVSVGGRYGVAYVGLPGKFFGLPSFLAMLAKHFINVVYFIQVLGWNKLFSYIRHEFFTIRNGRSFLGGHFSNRSPSFMLVPLRLYLGFYWLYEGLLKAGEGWLQSPRLTGFFSGASQFYENILNPSASAQTDGTAAASGVLGTGGTAGAADAVTAAFGSGAPDTVTAASAEAASSAGDLIFSLDLFQLVRLILVQADEYAFKVQVGLLDLLMNAVILPSEGLQMFFQIAIVLAEIFIGLALLGGLLTTPASAASLVLQAMFLTSTGLYMSSWWMPFAGIAMLFGGGRAFSLDYYVMPWLKKKWRKIRFIRKWYLYHD